MELGIYGIAFVPSTIRVRRASGYGSVNVNVRVFTLVDERTGDGIEYVSDSQFGDRFVITKSGFYSLFYSDASAAADCRPVLTVNNFVLGASFADISTWIIPYFDIGASSVLINSQSVTRYFHAGDIIRVEDQTNPGAASASDATTFMITKLI